ncbi:MAG: SRPBCC domain-containing protein [Spirochaetia bacterium]|nr:SRPBCC domain-containing protein [Spirochaetia bacterium]
MNRVVELERLVPFAVERVFKIWTNPEKFPKWFLADQTMTLGKVEADIRVGGKFFIEMIVGGKILIHSGEYTRIAPNAELAFTWNSHMPLDKDSLVEVTFESRGDKTLLKLRHTGCATEDSVKAHAAGWGSILDHFEKYISNGDTA